MAISKVFLLLGLLFVSFKTNTSQIWNPWRNITDNFWNQINNLCQLERKAQDLIDLNTDRLQIVEYTTFGFRTHKTNPSAARSLINSGFYNPKLPTVIFIHGFTDSPFSLPFTSLADAYKKHGGYNIIALDVSKVIEILYAYSAVAVKYVGEYLGTFINELETLGVDPNIIHMVGHSLGAHIAGFAGKQYQILNPGKKLPRITGLDPAQPCFITVEPDSRLSSNDARFVNIIHTNIGIYGMNMSIGHVDFFPNGGGSIQPGCFDAVCSHSVSRDFFRESVNNPNNFIGVQCDSWKHFMNHSCTENQHAVMGYATPSTTRGNFYLKTRGSPTFGMGDEGVE